MPYHMDFSKTSLTRLKERLERTDMIPSQLPLLDGLEEKLGALRASGIETLEDLSRALRGSKGPAALAVRSGVPAGYLILLRRMIEGFRPKPVRLREYPGVPRGAVEALERLGIRDGKALFEAAPDSRSAAQTARKAGLPAEAVRELLGLADLSRIQWVSPAFARALYEAGFRGAAAVAAAKPETAYGRVLRANEGGRFYGGKVGLLDMARLVMLAGELR